MFIRSWCNMPAIRANPIAKPAPCLFSLAWDASGRDGSAALTILGAIHS
jgi:hypothetical protein